MMTLEEARALLAVETCRPDGNCFVVEALRLVLKATEPISETDLALEATRYARSSYPDALFVATMAYAAGARRAGRRG